MTAPADFPAPPDAIGLLGGTFNPIHLGHLSIARDAMRIFHLRAVWFIPCAVSPLKSTAGLASNADRLAMIRLAIGDDPAFDVLPLEFDRPAPSYTFDTLHALRTLHPGIPFTFIIGADTLPQLHLWYRPLELLALARFVTLARPGHPPPSPEALHLPPPWPERLLTDYRAVDSPDIASRDIRARLAARQSIHTLVPAPVIRYIQEHQLYL